MFRIITATHAAGVSRYFAAADYHSEGRETIGLWGGKLAAELGLEGAVDPNDFAAMAYNRHPQTGERLTQRTREYRRIGYDMVISVPKGLSTLIGLLPAGHELDELVKETELELAQTIEADLHTRVRKCGAMEDRPTGNAAYAIYDHYTARAVGHLPPDPHRHGHLFFFNATRDPVEGRIKAGQFVDIKRDGEYYSALFDSMLAAKLEAAGYVIERKGGKAWDLAGLPESLITRFSKRTAEVEAEHARRMMNDPDYRAEFKHELGAKTRAKKEAKLSPEELREAWAEQLTDDERDAINRVAAGGAEQSRAVTAREAVTFAIDHCFEKESAVPERKLMATALMHGLGHVSVQKIRAELPRQGVIVREHDGRAMASTRSVQAEENFILGVARQGFGQGYRTIDAGIPCIT